MSFIAIYEADGYKSPIRASEDFDRLLEVVSDGILPGMAFDAIEAEEGTPGSIVTIPIEGTNSLACWGNAMVNDDGSFAQPYETITIYEVEDV